MSDKEFNRLLKLQLNLRYALREVKRARRKYPAGIEMLLTPEQFKKMKKVEDAITAETAP